MCMRGRAYKVLAICDRCPRMLFSLINAQCEPRSQKITRSSGQTMPFISPAKVWYRKPYYQKTFFFNQYSIDFYILSFQQRNQNCLHVTPVFFRLANEILVFISWQGASNICLKRHNKSRKVLLEVLVKPGTMWQHVHEVPEIKVSIQLDNWIFGWMKFCFKCADFDHPEGLRGVPICITCLRRRHSTQMVTPTVAMAILFNNQWNIGYNFKHDHYFSI